MKPVPKAIIGLVGALLLGAVLATPIRAQNASDSLDGNPDVVVHVEGMACQMCARSMKQSVSGVDGVEDVSVLLDEQKVHVALKDGAQKPSEKDFEDAVTRAGFSFKKAVYADDPSKSGA